MEKTEFLNYRALVLEVKQLKAYVDAMDRALSSAPGSQLSFMPKAPRSGGSSFEERVVRFHEMKALFDERRALSECQVVAIERAIQSLEAPAERLVMRLRYLEGRSWASVVSRLQPEGYSERQVYYIHGAALEKLKEV